MIPYSRLFVPYVGQEEVLAFNEVVDQQWLGLGSKVSEFEHQWSSRFGYADSVAFNSATAALHLSLSVYKFAPGSKVLVPALTFVSTAFAAIYNQLDVVFVDCCERTLGMCPIDLEKKYTSDCVAIIPMHYGGEPCAIDVITEFAKLHNLIVIEDCAHTQGNCYMGKQLGMWGDIGCYSFEEKKGMTTGDGGIACSVDSELLTTLRSKRWVGIDKDTWKRSNDVVNLDSKHWFYSIEDIGYKYNMNNVAASIGIAQLAKLTYINSKKTQIINRYLSNLQYLPHVKPILPYSCINQENSSYWIFGVRTQSRDALMRHLMAMNIATGVHFTPLNLQPYFSMHDSKDTPFSSSIYSQILSLPLHCFMNNSDVDFICESISDFFAKQ